MTKINRTHPDFIIGGAPRSGTTYLAHALDRHPQIYLAKPFIPEPKVFMGSPQTGAEYQLRYTDLFQDAAVANLCGEKTSYYFENEQACQRICEYTPDTKLIFILRDPVERAYSNYLWSKKNGLETLDFEQAVSLDGQRPDPLPPEKSYVRPFDYLQRGNYVLFAERYLHHVERSQILFLLYEDIERNPARLFAQLQAFLGVSACSVEQLDPGKVNSARESNSYMDDKLREGLRKKMTPWVRDFQALTNLDLTVWGYG